MGTVNVWSARRFYVLCNMGLVGGLLWVYFAWHGRIAMIVYPLSKRERRIIRAATVVIVILTIVIIGLMFTVSWRPG